MVISPHLTTLNQTLYVQWQVVVKAESTISKFLYDFARYGTHEPHTHTYQFAYLLQPLISNLFKKQRKETNTNANNKSTQMQ